VGKLVGDGDKVGGFDGAIEGLEVGNLEGV